MLRIAIIGCGKIADQHALAINRIPDSQIVAVCDREILMARQLAERFGITQHFSDPVSMLAAAKPDVVHITTPPQSHFSLARTCFEHDCHVYLEKPFTLTPDEAVDLIDIGERRGKKVTAGHNLQFTLEMLEMRRLVKEGFLGGRPIHLESHFSYSLEDTTYIGPVLGSRNHWVRQLPGQLLHNIISHGIAKLAEFLDDNLLEVNAQAHQSARLRQLGGQEVLDELRVTIRDANDTTAFFCFSTQIRPALNELRICGPARSLTVDHLSGSLVRQQPRLSKSYLTYFLPPLYNGLEHLRNARVNVGNFVRRRLHQDSGMKELIERFHESVRSGGTPPIPYREILLTTRLMDEIFSQIYGRRKSPETQATVSSTL